MSAGSGASNLGYGNIAPLSNINGAYVNVDSSNWPGTFGSNQIQGTPPGPLPGLAGAKSNIDAAAGNVPGICLFKGGAKKLKKKIKNITKHYKKMRAGSSKVQSIKKRLRHRLSSRKLARSLAGGKKSSRTISRSVSMAMAGGRTKRRHHRRRGQRGGYAQYQNNLPMTPTYQVAGINLQSNQLALANPPPIKVLPNCVNCTDNYNHYTNTGFPSKGH
jgi:hypothetical protein